MLFYSLINYLFFGGHVSVKNIEYIEIDLVMKITVEPFGMNDIVSHKKLTDRVVLDVIAVISNPARYKRRYQLFEEFCGRMKKEPMVRLTTIELQQSARPYVTDSKLKFRTDSELWHKENLINVAVQHLPQDAEYIAWVDSDLTFANPNWVRETIEQLQTYDVVQLFTHAIELGPNGEILCNYTGFAYLYLNEERMSFYSPTSQYKCGHVGYAWAMTKKAYNSVGGIPEFGILGSGDTHFAYSMIGEVKRSFNKKVNKNYQQLCFDYQDRALRHIKKNIGCVAGTVMHHFHGSKCERQYGSRWDVLIKADFDPLSDIYKDNNNIWVLDDKKIYLRDAIRRYFRTRNEDHIALKEDYFYTKKTWFS